MLSSLYTHSTASRRQHLLGSAAAVTLGGAPLPVATPSYSPEYTLSYWIKRPGSEEWKHVVRSMTEKEVNAITSFYDLIHRLEGVTAPLVYSAQLEKRLPDLPQQQR